MERLQKVIASTSVASRRKAEKMIVEGRVRVNGEVVTTLGSKVSSKDFIEVDGKPIVKEEKEYYLLNKPRGVICSCSDEKGRTTVVDLISTQTRIYPVGRLDYDTTGVLLLTNDGEFAHKIMSHDSKIDKVYLAKVEGKVSVSNIHELEEGFSLEDGFVKAVKAKIKKYDPVKNVSMVEIILHSGKNHQVKRMLEKVGHPVIKLTRERVGIFTVEDLKSGEYRKLSPKEIKRMYQ